MQAGMPCLPQHGFQLERKSKMTKVTNTDVNRQKARFKGALQETKFDWLPSPQAVIKKLARKRDAFFREAKERAGYKRTPKKAIEEARKTVKHLVCAVRHAQEHPDDNIRRAAKKRLKSTTHPGVSFEELSQRASKLHGDIRKAGERRANGKREAEAQSIDLGPRYRLVELTSKRKLRSAGKALGNCLRGGEFLAGYWKEVREGTTELWVLQRKTGDGDWKPHGLLKVDTTGPREIVECERSRNRLLKLKRKVAKAILRKLRASGDDVETFTRVGAFTAFRGGRPEVEPLQVGQRQVWIWRYPEEIILKVRRSGGKPTWMRLYRWDDIWLGDGEALGILADLLLAYPPTPEKGLPAPKA